MNLGYQVKTLFQSVMLRCGYCQLRDLILRYLDRRPVTILCYHVISERSHPNAIVPADFTKHIEFLKSHYQVVSIDAAMDYLSGAQIGGNPLCCITFDDGYQENLVTAIPILEGASCPAIFFLVSQCVIENRLFPDDKRRGYTDFKPFTPEEVKLLLQKHFSIGSHTVTHADCGVAENLFEIPLSKRQIEDEVKSPVKYFAFPYGRPETIHPDAPSELAAAGYRAAFSCFGGVNHRFGNADHAAPRETPVLRRIHIGAWDSMTQFEFQLRMQEFILFKNRLGRLFRMRS